jgi:AcrR family transcriptional regulator
MNSTPQREPSTAETIAGAAIKLAGERGWRSISLADIALEADVTLSELSRYYSCRPDILDGFERMIDRRMLAGAAAGDVDDKPRDRLFDIIMERLDALAPYREGVKRVARAVPFDPGIGLVLACALPRSIAWMFAGARIALDGPTTPLRIAVLGGVYMSTLRVFLREESEELSKTMAHLDRQLNRAAALLANDFGRTRPAAPMPSDGPPNVAEPHPHDAPSRSAQAGQTSPKRTAARAAKPKAAKPRTSRPAKPKVPPATN